MRGAEKLMLVHTDSLGFQLCMESVDGKEAKLLSPRTCGKGRRVSEGVSCLLPPVMFVIIRVPYGECE